PGEFEVVVAGGEDEGMSVEEGPGEPDAAEDAVLLEERVEHAGGASRDRESDRGGGVPDHDDGGGDAGRLEVIEDVAEDRLSAEVEQYLVTLLAQVLEPRRQARGRDESVHQCLFLPVAFLGRLPTVPCRRRANSNPRIAPRKRANRG